MDTTLVAERGERVIRPLDNPIVRRHLVTLRERDGEGWKLGGQPVEFRDGRVTASWMEGAGINRMAEEFALRMIRDTGCQIVDRSRGRTVAPDQLVGLLPTGRPAFTGSRRILRAMGW